MTEPLPRLWAYCRVSTSQQAESGGGIAAQLDLLQAGDGTKYHLLELVVDEAKSGKTLERPGLERILNHLDRGDGDGIVAPSLSRLSRSVIDFGTLLDLAKKQGWRVQVLEYDLDTGTATGRLIANILMSVAEWERSIIGERTKAALKAKQQQGIRVGRPRELDPDLERRIVAMNRTHKAWKIAEVLNQEGVAAPRGGKFWPSFIATVLARNLSSSPSPNGSGEET